MRPFAFAALASSLALPAQAPSIFATQVIAADTRGGLGGGIFNPSLALGAPGGWLDVHSLGVGGSLTLGFAVTIADGPGADLIVSENCFHAALTSSFAEVAFVEVSSNGVDFARFPAAYYGPQQEPGPFGTMEVGSYDNLAGQTPCLAATDPLADPQDVVEAGGDAFDLADLAQHPLVLQQRVDLQAIAEVRIVDAQSGVDRDSRGVLVRDPGAGSADIDAVTVIHHQGNAVPNGPRVSLDVRADGTFTLRLEDPDGWQDLDPASLRWSLWGQRLPFPALLSIVQVQQWDANGLTLVQPFPLPPGFAARVSVSVKDRAGHRSGQSRSRPDR